MEKDIRQIMIDQIEGYLGTMETLTKLSTKDMVRIYFNIVTKDEWNKDIMSFLVNR